MERSPSIAVVIPAVDEERAIGGCLASIGRWSDVEVAVSDGGSRDATLERTLAAMPSARIVTGGRGRGPQLARGAAATAAPVLLFLHADCRLPVGWRAGVERALADARVSVGCFRLRTEPPDAGSRHALARRFWRLLDLRARGLGLPYGDQALFTRRDVYDEVGGFPDIPLMEDVAFVRACLRRGRLARVPLEVRTTARRFAARPVRARLATATFPMLYRLGVSPATLARWYGNVR